MSAATRLLRAALPLVRTHGFTREALARSVLHLPEGQAHGEPLSDTAVSALFGSGDKARRSLIQAWLDEGLREMALPPNLEQPLDGVTQLAQETSQKISVKDILHKRLRYNEPVASHLSQAFALLASPTVGIPPVDPIPLIKHAVGIADKACLVAGENSLQLEWYARRGSLAAIYASAELHQLASPHTAHSFLDSLLESSSLVKSAFDETGLYASYMFKSWRGIIKSSGLGNVM